MLRFLLFDLDETLYPPQTGIFDEVGRRIHQYMQELLGVSLEQALQLRRRYYERYGTTLRGLQLHHQVDPDDYLAFVHNLDVSRYIRPNPALDAALNGLDQEKVLFTNATVEYARRVLDTLQVAHHFRRVFDIRALRFHCKPDPLAYRIVLEELAATGPECLLIEDNLHNLQVGKQMGMYTLLVGKGTGGEDGVDYHVPDIVQIRDVVHTLVGDQGTSSCV